MGNLAFRWLVFARRPAIGPFAWALRVARLLRVARGGGGMGASRCWFFGYGGCFGAVVRFWVACGVELGCWVGVGGWGGGAGGFFLCVL